MVKWLIFIILKIVEILAVLFVPFYAGLFLHAVGFYKPSPMGGTCLVWLAGIPLFMLAAIACSACFFGYLILFQALPVIVDFNMELAKKLTKLFR